MPMPLDHFYLGYSLLQKLKNNEFIPYLLIGAFWGSVYYIQEDALIYARVVENSSLFTWQYNQNEVYASTTSIFWFSIINTIHKISYIPITWILRLASLFVSIMIIYKLSTIVPLKDKITLLLSYSFLIISIYGMETALVVYFMLSLATADKRKISNCRSQVLLLTLSLLIRPDLIIFSLIYLILALQKTAVKKKLLLCATPISALLYVGFCFTIFGTFLPPSVLAKSQAYSTSVSLLTNLNSLIHFPIFLPEVSFLFGKLSLAINFTLLSCAIWLLKSKNTAMQDKAVIMASLCYLVSFGFVSMFPWYVLPPAFLLQTYLMRHSKFKFIIAILIILSAPLSLWKLKANELKENFRKSIGIEIGSTYRPDQKILLEPAGYIPFYSGLTAYDTIGLASPTVNKYRGVNDVDWQKMINDENIELVLVRSHIGFVKHDTLMNMGFISCNQFLWLEFKNNQSSFTKQVLTYSNDFDYTLYCKTEEEK